MTQYTYAERRRKPFNLIFGIQKQPLRVYVYDSGDKLKLGKNEFHRFQKIITALPVAAVCTEARLQSLIFCRAQIGLVDLICHYTDGPSNEHRLEISEPIFNQPIAVMVTNSYHKDGGPKAFKSAAHLVDILSRVFGKGVERIILRGYFKSWQSMEELYWPNAARLEALKDMYVNHRHSHWARTYQFRQTPAFVSHRPPVQLQTAYSGNTI